MIKERLHDHAAKINQHLLNAMNDRLIKGGEIPSWIPMVEHFVGLIRNTEKASKEDVQKYLKDAKLLQAKINQVIESASQMTLEVVEVHQLRINASESMFKAVQTQPKQGAIEDGHIRPLIDWSLTFCEYVKKVQSRDQAEAELNNIDDEINTQTQVKERVARMLQDLEKNDIMGVYTNIVDNSVRHLRPMIQEIAKTD